MASLCVSLTLLVALTLSLAATAAAQPLSGPEYIPLPPCRLADTRADSGFTGAYGAPALVGGQSRDFVIWNQCGVPAGAVAVAFNFTVVNATSVGFLTVYAPPTAVPLAALLQFGPGQSSVVSDSADLLLSADGRISAFVATDGTVDLIINVYGYFTDVEELVGGNTALGNGALAVNTSAGISNTALGFGALRSNTEGDGNTATGIDALRNNTTGGANTAMGIQALFNNTTGNNNTAIGASALRNATGNNNTAIGNLAGVNVTTGSNNIHIGSIGNAADTALIRIGAGQAATFIEGIRGVTTGVPNAISVLIDVNGQLGTTASSRRVKTDIHDLGDQSRALHQLRPVSFRYRSHPPDGPLEYGLIAEAVAEIYPELVVRDTDGQPSGVRYHVLPAMLLNELQRQQRQLEAQQRELDELRAQVRALVGAKAAVRE